MTTTKTEAEEAARIIVRLAEEKILGKKAPTAPAADNNNKILYYYKQPKQGWANAYVDLFKREWFIEEEKPSTFVKDVFEARSRREKLEIAMLLLEKRRQEQQQEKEEEEGK